MQLQKAPNTTARINNKDYLFFSGTSYLGVPLLPSFQELVTQSILKWGTSYGSSRAANLKLEVYQRGEQLLSNFLKTENVVTVSCGTLASQFALKSLQTLADSFYYMPKTHPSILPDDAKPVFKKGLLNSELKKLENQTICIVSDAIAALETNPFSFDFLSLISVSNTIYLLIDESHSLGVLGKKGNGISSQIQTTENIKMITVSSLGKAFGVNGGVIAGSTKFINLVKSDSLFIGCAGMSPAFLEAFVNAQELYKKQLEKLQKNAAYVYEKIHHLNKVRMSINYPVFFFEDEKIADYLHQKNILITSFYYPATTKKINRVVLNANHTTKQLDVLIHAVLSFKSTF